MDNFTSELTLRRIKLKVFNLLLWVQIFDKLKSIVAGSWFFLVF